MLKIQTSLVYLNILFANFIILPFVEYYHQVSLDSFVFVLANASQKYDCFYVYQ